MSQLTMWNLIIGFGVPLLISIIKQPTMPKWVRTLITVVVCLIGGLGTTYFNGHFNVQDVVGSLLTVAVAAMTFYEKFWKQLGVTQAIFRATSRKNHTKAA